MVIWKILTVFQNILMVILIGRGYVVKTGTRRGYVVSKVGVELLGHTPDICHNQISGMLGQLKRGKVWSFAILRGGGVAKGTAFFEKKRISIFSVSI